MGISKPTAERLAQLARVLEQNFSTQDYISSAELEHATGWPRDTIRKDISTLNAGPEISTSTGYDPIILTQVIRDTLGLSATTHKCCIVGLGRLGSAFLEYSGFQGSPFSLCAGFDSNVNRIEILQADFPLYPSFRMKEVIPRLGISFAILCVPPQHAQSTVDRLLECGITGLINFTPSILSVPSGIEIENVSVIDALGALAARIAVKRSEQ